LDHLAENGEYTPYNEGGKETILESREISMTHDELMAQLGPAFEKITAAGFVLVPKSWRDDVFNHLEDCEHKRRMTRPPGDASWATT
jgi:hypothetical protein